MLENLAQRTLVGIGIGGIAQGWIPPLLLNHQTGTLPFNFIHFIDGKLYSLHNKGRQHFEVARNKAAETCALWQRLYPKTRLQHFATYITHETVSAFVHDGDCVLLSPDNHATRKVVCDYAQTLKTILVVTGGNDLVNAPSKGINGTVLVYFRKDDKDITPPYTKHHPEIAHPSDVVPTELSCDELGGAFPQLLQTNLLVGQLMVLSLHRYCSLPDEAAIEAVELWINSRTGKTLPYGIKERPV